MVRVYFNVGGGLDKLWSVDFGRGTAEILVAGVRLSARGRPGGQCLRIRLVAKKLTGKNNYFGITRRDRTGVPGGIEHRASEEHPTRGRDGPRRAAGTEAGVKPCLCGDADCPYQSWLLEARLTKEAAEASKRLASMGIDSPPRRVKLPIERQRRRPRMTREQRDFLRSQYAPDEAN
jgi:hypothetical protein